jgi:hypothetical protein
VELVAAPLVDGPAVVSLPALPHAAAQKAVALRARSRLGLVMK